MQPNGDMHKCVAVCINNLNLAPKTPFDSNNSDVKGPGPIVFHLGRDFFCDSDGVCFMATNKHIEDVIAGVVEPMNEQGGNIPRMAAVKAGWPHTCVARTHAAFGGGGSACARAPASALSVAAPRQTTHFAPS